MKIDKLNIDGKKDSIEIADKILDSKINKQLIRVHEFDPEERKLKYED